MKTKLKTDREVYRKLKKEKKEHSERAVKHNLCKACGDYISKDEEIYIGLIHTRCYRKVAEQTKVIEQLEAENKKLKNAKHICPCGGVITDFGISKSDGREVWECTKCQTQIKCEKP